MSSPVQTSTQWFYVVEDRQIGPVTQDQLIRLSQKGFLQPDTFVWREGLKDWVEARRLSFLQFQAPVATINQVEKDDDEEEDEEPKRPKKKKRKRKLEYGTFWNRVVGFIVDYIIVFAANFVVFFCVGFVLGASNIEVDPKSPILNAASILVFIVLHFLYYSVMESSEAQATVGKMAAGVKVVDLDGNRIGYLQACGRWLGRFLCGLSFGIGYLMAAFSERAQGLHDIVAGTLVVKS